MCKHGRIETLKTHLIIGAIERYWESERDRMEHHRGGFFPMSITRICEKMANGPGGKAGK